ncbi:MAG: zinc metalloprotease HtpX [Deltaproteobacteria bacterium]
MPGGKGIFRRRQQRNRRHSVLLIGLMVIICAFLGWSLAGSIGLVMLGALAGVILLVGPRVSHKLVLKMYGATRLRDRDAPELIHLVRTLANKAGLPVMPQIYYVPSEMVNAFSVGTRDNPSMAFTDGILRNLATRELTGVTAHEVAHIRNNDGWVMGLADSVSQIVYIMSWTGQILLFINLPLFLMGSEAIPWIFIIVLILAPTLSSLLQLALSRTREYDADLDAIRLTGDPRGLASALAKLEQLSGSFFERIFLPGRRIPEPSLLRTHPSTEDRIKRLLELEKDLTKKTPDADHGLPGHLKHRLLSHIVPPRWHINRFWY